MTENYPQHSLIYPRARLKLLPSRSVSSHHSIKHTVPTRGFTKLSLTHIKGRFINSLGLLKAMHLHRFCSTQLHLEYAPQLPANFKGPNPHHNRSEYPHLILKFFIDKLITQKLENS